MPDFVHSIHMHPDLVCACDEFDRVLLLQSPVSQLLLYDTIIKLRDFYLSTLAF